VAPTPPKEQPKERTFTQAEANTWLAEDRRRSAERYAAEQEATNQANQVKFTALEDSYHTILDDKNLEAEQRVKLQTELGELQSTFRTKEQQLVHDRQVEQVEYKQKLEAYEKASQSWESLYRKQTLEAALAEAVMDSGAENKRLLLNLLRSSATLEDAKGADGTPTGELDALVSFEDKDAEGNIVQSLKEPKEAVKRMRELTDLYGGLFRADAVGGVGSEAVTGDVTPGKPVDGSKLSMEAYMAQRDLDPTALGLDRKTLRRKK
jgi:hypothetical protein